MHYKFFYYSALAGLIVTACCASVAVAHPFQIDQISEGNPFGSYGIDVQTGDTIGQEFTPTASALDVVEIGLGPHTPGSVGVRVNIRQGSLSGAIVGTSLLATIPTTPQPAPKYHFDFASPVPLVPGKVYVIQPVLAPPNVQLAFAYLDSPLYAGGRAIVHGAIRDDVDMVFRTGLSIPEPSAAVLGLVGASALFRRGRRTGRLNDHV
jgi:hypothetical protein